MKNELISIMSEVFETNLKEIDGDIKQENIENWDSLSHLTLVVELEEFFSVSFEPDEISEMNSIQKIQYILQKKKNAE
jgi:acyl carrier protein